MFNKNFYPTPYEAYKMLCVNPNGKVILEPHGGSGSLIDHLYNDGAKEVLTCELDPKLAMIAKSKAKFLKPNFFDLTSIEISHIDLIVMNPPFDNADQHLLHAYEICPDGCEIYAFVNSGTITNPFSTKRKQLGSLIEMYGSSYSIGPVFSDAERTTDVDVSVVYLAKPAKEKTEFADFFTDDQDDEVGGSEGLMTFNEIRSIVQRYVKGCEDYKELMKKSAEMFENLSALGVPERIKMQVIYNQDVRDYEGFKKDLQKVSWGYVFQKLGMDKYVTEGVKTDLNKFIEQNEKYPFTMKNIYAMIDVLIQTRSQVMERSIVDAIGKYTMHTHENRYSVEGWKTNKGHMLNQKIIVNGMITSNYSGSLRMTNYRQADDFRDLVKAICFLTGRDYDDYNRVFENATAPMPHTYSGKEVKAYPNSFADGADRFKPNTWYKAMDLFEIKVFKKGTAHIRFIDLKAWETLNRTYARILGQVLPEKI